MVDQVGVGGKLEIKSLRGMLSKILERIFHRVPKSGHQRTAPSDANATTTSTIHGPPTLAETLDEQMELEAITCPNGDPRPSGYLIFLAQLYNAQCRAQEGDEVLLQLIHLAAQSHSGELRSSASLEPMMPN